MSSEPTFSTLDLRSNAQDYKRDACHKHKWALGSVEKCGRAVGKPRPVRPFRLPRKYTESSYRHRHRDGNPVVIPSMAHTSRKHDAFDTDDSSAGSASDEFDEPVPTGPAVDAGVMYSFDAPAGPSQGSQILTLALSKAVERFEERETTRLVHSEYDVLDSDGETVPASADKKRKHKHKSAVASSSSVAAELAGIEADDDDYEFV